MNKLEYDDLTTEQQDICGTGEPQPVRKFAHELRKAIWKKIFGITGKERAVTELQSAIDQPANPKSWQAIQRVAQRNTQLYEAAFKFIPRNEPIDPILPALKGKRPEGASIWPVWNYNIDAEVEEGKEKQLGIQQGFMPFQTEFWVKSHPQAAQAHQEAAKAHQQAAAVHEKAAEAHQQAVQAHSQILLKATLMVGDFKTQIGTHLKATNVAHDASKACGTPNDAAKKQADQIIANHQAKTAQSEAEKAVNQWVTARKYALQAMDAAIALANFSTSLSRNRDSKESIMETDWRIVRGHLDQVIHFHTEAAAKNQQAAKNHDDAAKAHMAAAENHDFTDDPEGQVAAAQLSQVKGYITLLPIHWTEGENNNLGYHTAAITKNEVNPPTEMMAHAEQGPGEKPA